MYKLAGFLIAFAGIAFAGIVLVSWRPLREPRSHGFYRFFAFMSILGLLWLNVEQWFASPFSPPQIVSWVLLVGSLVLAGHGFYLLRVIGKPKGEFEDTTHLVKIGTYRYIRHPLYASLLLFGWGAFLKDVSLWSGSLALLATVFLVATARVEKAENSRRFGLEYAAYLKTTRMFIPGLF